MEAPTGIRWNLAFLQQTGQKFAGVPNTVRYDLPLDFDATPQSDGFNISIETDPVEVLSFKRFFVRKVRAGETIEI